MLKMENKIKSEKDATNYIKKKRKKTRQNKNKTFWWGNTTTWGHHNKNNELWSTYRHPIAKSNRRINLLKLLSGTDWGCNPKTIMRIYKTYVRPVLEYVAIVMLSAAQVHLEKLQKVQNKAFRIAFRKPIHTRIRPTWNGRYWTHLRKITDIIQ